MTKAVFSLESVRSQILDGAGLARTNRFEVLIPPPRALADRYSLAELASSYIEQANIPLLNIFSKPFKIFGPTYQRPISSEYGGEGLPITFHVDRDMEIRRFFEDWMHAIIDPDTFTVNYQENYITDVIIRQLNEQDEITNEIVLLEAFPRNLNLMDLNNASTNQTHRLNVLFAYRYWKNTSRVAKQPTVVPRQVAYPQVPRADLPENFPEIRQFDWTNGNITGGSGSDLPPGA